MHPIWQGAISFGLVSIPIRLYAATESREIHFHQLHEPCGTPIRYQKFCPSCQREVGKEELARGYEYEKGRLAKVGEEALEALPLPGLHAIHILDFVDLKEIDPIFYLRSYLVAPGEFGLKPYRLLFGALEESNKVAVAKVVLRNKENLACLRVYRGSLLLATMFFPEELRSPADLPGLKGEVEVSEQELKMAKTLVENLSAPFQPEKYHSGYREALAKLLEQEVVPAARKEEAPPLGEKKVVDLLEALRLSVEQSARRQKTAGKRGRKAKTG